jgi:hypothetical protein
MSSDRDKRSTDSLSQRQSFGETARRRRREAPGKTPRDPAATKNPAKPAKDDHVTLFGSSAPAPVEGPGEVLLTWSVWRLRDKPLMSAAVIAGLGLLLYTLQSWTGSLGTAAVLTLLVVISLAQFLFPITYTLSENGLHVRNLPITNDYKRWSRFGIWRAHSDAVQIAPVVVGARARFNRGMLVYFGTTDPERVKGIIREKVGREV